MGNDTIPSPINGQQWITIQQLGPKTILRNISSQALLDTYEITEHKESQFAKHSQDIYRWRRAQGHFQPLLLHYNILPEMIGSYQKQRVVTEHLIRFCQLPPISKQESFLLLQQILTALPALFVRFGLFNPNVFGIGINQAGMAKVWVNQNLARNGVEVEDTIRQATQNVQLTILNNLVRLLKTKVFNAQSPPQFPFSLTFSQALSYIQQIRNTWPQYSINKVYINRNEFSQATKSQPSKINQNTGAYYQTNQIIQVQPPIRQVRKSISPSKLPHLQSRTVTPTYIIQHYKQVALTQREPQKNSPYNNGGFIPSRATSPFSRRPASNQPSPSPPKFIKRMKEITPKPAFQQKLKQQQKKYEKPRQLPPQKAFIEIRPREVSLKKGELSKIIEVQQSKIQVNKEQIEVGKLKVELVESIYIKSSETQEGI